MYRYINASETDRENVYKAFIRGFSDYMIRFDMNQEDFFRRFFGPDGNELALSFVALSGNEPVGVVLGGIRDFDGVKTMRCGALSIVPEHRGKGVSDRLLELHLETAKDRGCRQLFLEVIRGNDRAVAFYEKKGYEKIYDLHYYTLDKSHFSGNLSSAGAAELKEMSFSDVHSLKEQFSDIHLNWQTDFQAMEKMNDIRYYGAYEGQLLKGVVAFRDTGKIYLIWVDRKSRSRHLGSLLMKKAIDKTDSPKMHISFSNHAGLSGFVKSSGFVRDELSQFEMYRLL